MVTLSTRIHDDAIECDVSHDAPEPPASMGDARTLTGYTVTLHLDGREMTTPIYMGAAHVNGPTALDVMQVLLSDASGVENARNFEEWASEFGLDTDSREEESGYRAVLEQTEALRTFLGERYSAYLWETDHE